MPKIRVLAVGLLALASLSACSSGANSSEGQEQGLESLTVGLIGAASEGPVHQAIDEGLFEKQGLEITTTVIPGPPAMVAALQSGEVDVAFLPTVPYINAVSQGVPLTAVAGFVELPTENPEEFLDSGIYVNPKSGIEAVDDLGGKNIAIPARKGSIEVATTADLNKTEVDPASVKWLSLDQGAALESLKAGRVDAAYLYSPFSVQATEEGMELLLKPGTALFAGLPTDFFAAGQEATQKKAEALQKFRTALYEATTWANENTDEAVELGAEKAGLEISELPPMRWASGMDAADLDAVAQSMIDLGFLSEKPDFSPLVMK